VNDEMRSTRVNIAEELMKVKEELGVSGLLDGIDKAGPALPPAKTKGVPSETWDVVNSEVLKRHVGHRVEVSGDADWGKHLIQVLGVERIDSITKAQIIKALQAEPGLNSREIHVKVHRGRVVLRGDVPSAEERTVAERIAASFFEIRQVENRLGTEGQTGGFGFYAISLNIMSMGCGEGRMGIRY
jgi:hypothetical protein